MRIANSFSPEFIDGFVKKCQEMEMSAEEAEIHFRKHANNSLMSEPSIYEGFRDAIAKYEGPIPKSAMTRYLTPDMISLAVDCRIKYGNDLLSRQMRQVMNLPEPSWAVVPDHIKAAASDLSASMDSFDHLPLNQKILLAALLGGGAGGGIRALSPSAEDSMLDRSLANRVTRGVGRGALTGAGAAVGAGAGSEVSDALSGPPTHEGSPTKLPAMMLGGLLGGMGGFKLGE